MHISGYFWKDNEPFIKYYEGLNGGKMRLFDRDLRWRVGKRACIGYFDGKKRLQCPELSLSASARCDKCQIRDWFHNCKKCDGTKCINEKRRDDCAKEEYVIYLAVFGPILKVGISQTFRKMTRWVEQGADFAAEIRRVKDGMLARKIEATISRRLGIVDRVRGSQKNSAIFYDPNESLELLVNAIERINGISDYDIHDLRSYYRLDRVTSIPDEITLKDGTEIVGRVVAVKGNLMIYEAANGFKMINLHRLSGRVVTEIM